ncbi:SDR family NAD(P)-dependent oxidoreductase [Actinomadura rubrisoli]|uniref:SDR family NAD(P)-dependent oxidoreductase n=1 Tax=Actinomadura rubrisoli TaxID=2530368 RepID=A0A4R5CDK6_9ACTN|nr:SDR family NAD(P)-dependent oxidoreductase [Actinomadura rubrisoli]TDD98131.1 SDR family NAD(P)-dependent oxidoreductase [Actinomadura rubrisoli]
MADHPILITGCSSGIGRAAAARLARAGHLVYATARRPETLAELEELGCRTLRLDLTDPESMIRAVDAVQQRHGRVATLVNNAGYAEMDATEQLDSERIRRQFDTNVFGPLRLAQLVLPAMRDTGGGRIINIGSIADRCVLPLWGGYAASKHALSAFTEALRMETRRHGVHVILIEPGVFDTQFSHSIDRNLTEHRPRPSGPYRAQLDGFRSTLHGVLDLADDRTAAPHRPGGRFRSLLFARLSADPDVAAKTIEHAATAPRPRSRYRIPAHAHLAFAARALLPARLWDAAVTAMFLGPQDDHPAVKKE